MSSSRMPPTRRGLVPARSSSEQTVSGEEASARRPSLRQPGSNPLQKLDARRAHGEPALANGAVDDKAATAADFAAEASSVKAREWMRPAAPSENGDACRSRRLHTRA